MPDSAAGDIYRDTPTRPPFDPELAPLPPMIREVIPPISEGANKAEVIREYCEKYNLAANKSHAYTESAAESAMLTAVGRPTAGNPDPRLRALARIYDFPIPGLR